MRDISINSQRISRNIRKPTKKKKVSSIYFSQNIENLSKRRNRKRTIKEKKKKVKNS